jgi:hypothetical protein
MQVSCESLLKEFFCYASNRYFTSFTFRSQFPAYCVSSQNTSSCLKFFHRCVNIGFCRYTSFTILIPKCPLALLKWARSPLFTKNKHTLFTWVHVCGTHNHSTLSQTPVWQSRLDVTGKVHFIEGYDGSASIDVKLRPYQFSWGTIQKVINYSGMFWFSGERITLYVF